MDKLGQLGLRLAQANQEAFLVQAKDRGFRIPSDKMESNGFAVSLGIHGGCSFDDSILAPTPSRIEAMRVQLREHGVEDNERVIDDIIRQRVAESRYAFEDNAHRMGKMGNFCITVLPAEKDPAAFISRPFIVVDADWSSRTAEAHALATSKYVHEMVHGIDYSNLDASIGNQRYFSATTELRAHTVMNDYLSGAQLTPEQLKLHRGYKPQIGEALSEANMSKPDIFPDDFLLDPENNAHEILVWRLYDAGVML